MRKMKNKLCVSRIHKYGFLVAIALTKFAVMGDFALYPVTDKIFTAYSNTPGLANYIVSGPTLLILITSLATPILLKKANKRTLVIIGIALFSVGGIFGALFLNPWWMAGMRSLVGIGQGLLSVLAVTYLSDVFSDPDQQAKYVGVLNATGNLAAMCLSFLAGLLALGNWKNIFYLYLIGIPMLLAALIFIPKVELSAVGTEGIAPEKKKSGFVGEFWYLIAVYTLFSVLRTVVTYYMSTYVAEYRLGDSVLTATATSMSQLFAFCGGMLFSIIYKRIKQGVLVLTLSITASAFIIWTVYPTTITVYVVYCLIAGASGCLMAYCYVRPMQILPAVQKDTAISILTALGGVAGFVPTYLVSWLVRIRNSGTFCSTMPIYVGVAIVLLLSAIFHLIHTPKNKSQ